MRYSRSADDIVHFREVLGSALEHARNLVVVLRDGKEIHGKLISTHTDHTHESASDLWSYGGEITVTALDGSTMTLDCQDIEKVGPRIEA